MVVALLLTAMDVAVVFAEPGAVEEMET